MVDSASRGSREREEFPESSPRGFRKSGSRATGPAPGQRSVDSGNLLQGREHAEIDKRHRSSAANVAHKNINVPNEPTASPGAHMKSTRRKDVRNAKSSKDIQPGTCEFDRSVHILPGKNSALENLAESSIQTSQASNEFDRGPTASKSAKLFDPRKDKIPLVKKDPARVPDTAQHTAVQIPGKDKKHRSGQSRKKSGKQSQTVDEIEAFVAPAGNRQKQAATATVSRGERTSRSPGAGKLFVLQKSDLPNAPPEMIRQLVGTQYDQYKTLEHARKLHAEIEIGEKAARTLIVNSDSSAQLTAVQFRHVTETHRALLDAYYDFLVLTQHPQASEAVRKMAISYNICNSVWTSALKPVLDLPDVDEGLCRSIDNDSLADSRLSFIYYGYGLVSSLLVCVPDMQFNWLIVLAKLSSILARMKGELVFGSDWQDVALMWQKSAICLSPGYGEHLIKLAQMCHKENLLERTLYFCKARFALEPESHTAESSLNDLYRSVIFPASSYTGDDSVESCFIRAHAISRIQYATCDYQNTMTTAIESKSDHAIGAVLAFINVSAVHSYFTIDAKHTTDLTGTNGVPSIDLIGRIPARKATHEAPETLRGAPLDLTIAMFDLACEADEHDDLPHIFVWLMYLTFAVRQPYWNLLENKLPWTNISRCISRKVDSPYCTRDLKILGTLPVMSLGGVPRLLPEDSIIRGSIFSQKAWPEELFNNIDYADENLSLFSKNQLMVLRNERILWLAYELADCCTKLDFDMSSHASIPRKMSSQATTSRKHPLREILPGYTTLIIDSSILLVDLELLHDAVANGLNLIVPICAIQQLDELRKAQQDQTCNSRTSASFAQSKGETSVAVSIEKVLTSLESLIQLRRIKVVLADGSNMRDLSFRDEVENECRATFSERVVAAAVHQMKYHPSERGSIKRNDSAEPALLLSASFKVRMASFAASVPAVSPSVVRASLKMSKRRIVSNKPDAKA